MTTEQTSTALKEKAQNIGKEKGVAKSQRPEDMVAGWLKQMQPEIAKAIPKHITPDRMLRVCLTAIRLNPNLLKCEKLSLMGAVMQSAALGLEPGVLGHCYIIPYGNQAQFIIGYKGMIDLARRSGEIQSIRAREVYQNDFFQMKYGIVETLEHIPWHMREDKHFDEPGKLRGVYMVANFKDGGYFTHYLTEKEVAAHRSRSKASESGPWKTDYIPMVRKTCIRSAFPWLPVSIEIARAMENDEQAKSPAELAEEYIDITPIAYDEPAQIAAPAEPLFQQETS